MPAVLVTFRIRSGYVQDTFRIRSGYVLDTFWIRAGRLISNQFECVYQILPRRVFYRHGTPESSTGPYGTAGVRVEGTSCRVIDYLMC